MQKTTDIATYSWHLTDLQIFVFNRVAGSWGERAFPKSVRLEEKADLFQEHVAAWCSNLWLFSAGHTEHSVSSMFTEPYEFDSWNKLSKQNWLRLQMMTT